MVAAAFGAASNEFFQERRDRVRLRQDIIDANPELQERELIKLASLASALAEGLRTRGVGDSASSLAAEAGIAVFKIAFEDWVHSSGERTLSDGIRAFLDELKDVTTPPRPVTRR